MGGSLHTEGLDRLRPYAPRLLLQWLAETPDQNHREVEGSIAFVDISGFTKLSERLARNGKVGAEELTDAIGTCFARLLGVAYGNGGGLIKFGGDALLILFTGTGHEEKATRAAVGMRRALKEIGTFDASGTRVTLRMSVGIHSGAFHFFLVGDSHRELIVTGPAASQTVLMESTASAGEILVSAATAARLPEWALGVSKGPGRLVKREPRGLSPERAVTEQSDSAVNLLPCIPVAIRDRLLAGLGEPEHKRVTVAFIHYDGTDALVQRSSAAATEYLEELVGDVQRAVDRHGLCFLGSDIDHDGGKIILTAGAPVATGNDEERMLLALREIMDCERAVPIRAGVNRGHVFVGDIGPSYRRTYTVMGDAVNLAARLMAKARAGEILATEGVLAQSRTEFRTTALEPFMVKGKSHAVEAHSVGPVDGVRGARAQVRSPLVGREREMAVLEAALESVYQGQGRVVEIIGEPGIGKSRLIEELRDRAAGAVSLSGSCQLYESSTPYFPFRGLLRAALGITDADGNEGAGARLVQLLETNVPQLLPWSSLLAIPLDVELPPTPEVEQLDDEFRRLRLHDATRELLTSLFPGPTLFTFEDTHWMDEASSELLRRLTVDLEGLPWFFCVTRRDVDSGFTAPVAPHVDVLRPEPLDASAATALVDAVTEDSPLAPHEIAALAERAGGNPLFLQELLTAAQAAGGIEGLPDSVEAVIMARIDRLAPAERSLLRRLSVLGQNFDRVLAEAVADGALPSSEDAIWPRLAEFIGDDGGKLHFRHALIRDGAYDGLPFRLRRRLHALVGETIEHAAGSEPDDHAELLSLHFFHAHSYDRAWWYSSIAAERARAIYSNVEAADFYERALDCARRVGGIPGSEMARVYESLGDVRNRIGEYQKAADAYRMARRLTNGDSVGPARLFVKQGQVRQQSGRYSEALRWLRKANRALETLGDIEAARQRAQIAVAHASVHKDQGRPAQVITWSTRAIEEAERASDKDALAHAYLLLDTAHVVLGKSDRAVHFDRALALYEELGDLWGQGVVLNNLGTQAYWRGRWNEAIALYERAREAWEKIGDVVNAARGFINVGEILSDQGRLEEAEALFRKALRVWKAAGFRSGVAHAMAYLGRVASRSGRFSEAMQLLTEARAGFEHVGASANSLETQAWTAECLVFQSEGETALALANDALDHLGGASSPLTALLLRVKGWALEQCGDYSTARAIFEQSLQVARATNADYETALTLRALARADGDPGSSLHEDESTNRAILERLGVIRAFEAPLVGDLGSHEQSELATT